MLIWLPFEINDKLKVRTDKLPIDDMYFENDVIPEYVTGRVISVRRNCHGTFVKIGVCWEWYETHFDEETGENPGFFMKEKIFTYPTNAIGKTLFPD